MRLLRVEIPDFGPLRDVDLELAPGLNVVHGPNESGKTTLLDFLLAHLFRWDRHRGTRLETVLGDLDRFGDATASGGRIRLELAEEVMDYPDAPSLLHRLGLEHAGLAGLFCVRSGELELPGTEEGEFWNELKKVLWGLPRGMDTLREAVHEAAGLTPTGGALSDRGDPGRRTRHRRLLDRLEVLEGLVERLPEAAELEREIERLEGERRRLELARRARVAELAGELEAARERLAATPEVEAREVERWAELETERARAEEDAKKLRSRLEAHRRRLEAGRSRRQKLEVEARRLEERSREAERRELEERARRHLERRREAEADPGGGERLRKVAGPVLLVLGLAGAFFTPSDILRRPPVLGGLALLLTAGAALILWEKRIRARQKRRLEDARRRLGADAAACGLEDVVPEELPEAVRELDRRVYGARGDVTAAEERVEAARERVQEGERELEEVRERKGRVETRLDVLRGALDFPDLESARGARRKREEAAETRRRLRAELEALAGPDESRWRAEPPDGEDLPPWDAEVREEIETRLRGLREEYRELRRSFDQAGLESPEDVVPELEACRQEIRRIELDRDAGRLAGSVFAGMDEALEARLTDALREEAALSVSGLLGRVTGRYRRVLRREDGELAVRDEAGRVLPLPHLSRGTRDQVHLVVRLGLAAAALESAGLEEPGFFLLDDAFLTADWERRRRLVEASGDLTEEGWQVIYLTCDDHLRELYAEAGAEVFQL